MKQDKDSRRLELNRERLRPLSGPESKAVVGGTGAGGAYARHLNSQSLAGNC